MKKLIVLLLFVLFCSNAYALSPILSNSLIIFDSFRSTSSDNVSSLYGAKATFSGSYVNSGKAIEFTTGGNQAINWGTDFIGTGDVTFFIVCKTISLGDIGSGRLLDNGKLLIYMSADNKLRISSNGATNSTSSNANGIVFGDIQIWAITRAANGEAVIYLNGEINQTGGLGTGTPASATSQLVFCNRQDLTRDYDGFLYHLSIYKGILSKAEIRHQTEVLKRWYQAENN